MNIFEPEERKRINLKLIELVKPHEVLYNHRKGIWRHYFTHSFILWTEITTSMNDFFKMDWSELNLVFRWISINQILMNIFTKTGMEEWRGRWRMLRNDFAKKINYNMERRSAISKELEFLRPFINKGRKRHSQFSAMKRYPNRETVTILVTTSTYSHQTHRNTQPMVTDAEVLKFIANSQHFFHFVFQIPFCRVILLENIKTIAQ